MTIRELILQLNAVPEERRDEDVRIYVQGTISGFLKIEGFKLDKDVSREEKRRLNVIESVYSWQENTI